MTERRMPNLTEADTLRFLDLYKAESVLYNTYLKEHRNSAAKYAAALRVSNALGVQGFGPDEVFRKAKGMRKIYRKELKKMGESQKLFPDMIYTPKTVWFAQMDFIRPFVHLKCDTEHNKGVAVKRDASLKASANSSPSGDGPTVLVEPIRPSNKHTRKRHLSFDSSRPVDNKNNKRARSIDENLFERAQSFMERTNPLPNSETDVDSHEHFGRYIASLLRIAGYPYALQLQRRILLLITEYFDREDQFSLMSSLANNPDAQESYTRCSFEGSNDLFQ